MSDHDQLAAPDLNSFDYMEVDMDALEADLHAQWHKDDPNLFVTSATEQLDISADLKVLTGQKSPGTPCTASEDLNVSLAELTTGYESSFEYDEYTKDKDFLEDFQGGLYQSSQNYIDLNFNAEMSKGLMRPTTVTLIGPRVADSDPETRQLLWELYKDDAGTKSSYGCGKQNGSQNLQQSAAPMLKQPQSPTDAATGVPNLPLFEPFQAKSEVQTPAFDQLSSTDSLDTDLTYSTEDGGVVSPDREVEIDRKASYIREVIEKRGNKPEDMSSKLKVHEVILVILLNASHGNRSKDLQRILTFCDEDGKERSGDCQHFKTLDTETMGLLWQKIKGNKKGNYDTFARAMRVRRERSEGFFEYLDIGKGKRKRIYRFGAKSMAEMARFKQTLKQVSKPQTCSY